MAGGAFRFVAFLSDFGWGDEFVGVCKGVIMEMAPGTVVLDISHDVPPGDVGAGAWVLAAAAPHFPPAVFLAVVDPGVGTVRRALCLRSARGSLLVGPDNGLLLPAAEALGGVVGAWGIENEALFRLPLSPTFHGRDLFAPVAARLAVGLAPEELGPALDPATLSPPPFGPAEVGSGWVRARVVASDRFGNLSLNCRWRDLERAGLLRGGRIGLVWRRGRILLRPARTFSEGPEREVLLIEDSRGGVQLSVNRGSARGLTGIGHSEEVLMEAVGEEEDP